MKQNLNKIFVVASLFLAIGCNWLVHERPEFHNVKAEITGIEKVSDTSVLINIDVIEGGNSEGCGLWIYFDTVTVQRSVSVRSRPVTSIISDCLLEKTYAITISPLEKRQQYFFQIFQHAYWYPSGTTTYRDIFIGSPQKFTIQ